MIRRRTVVVATAAVLLCLGAALAGGIAMLTQTDRGLSYLRSALVPTLSAAIDGHLYVGDIHGSLFSDLTIDSLELREPNGGPFLSTGRIKLTYDPRDLLDRRIILKSVDVEHPTVTLVDYSNDDWNWKRALSKSGPSLPSGGPKSSFGQYIVVDTAALKEMTVVIRLPWFLPDSLKGAQRDSAVKFNVARNDAEIRSEPNRLTRTWRFVRGNVALGRTRLADPDTAGQQFSVQKLDVAWMMPPFWFRNMHMDVHRLADTIWMNDVAFNLANSKAHGTAKVVHGGGIPVRYDVRLHGDTVAMADVSWIDPSLPWTGSGSVDFTIKNDPKDLEVLEYGLRNMDAHSMRSHLLGNMTFAVGGPVLRVSDVALDMAPANTDLLRQFNGEPFPFDWQGNLTARVVAKGGPVNTFVIDHATFSYADAHVPGAVSSGSAKGIVDIFTPSLAILKGLDLQLNQLDLRTPRYVNKLFPDIAGIVRGSVRLDSLWFDARFSNADLEHIDGPGEPSRFLGDGRISLLKDGVKFDVNLQAAPINYTMLARSYKGLPLHGTATGAIKAAGMAEDFSLATLLGGEGGELAFNGQVDAFGPDYGAAGQYHIRGLNLRTLFADATLPLTSLNMGGETNFKGADLNTLRGTLSTVLEAPSRFGSARLYAAQTQLAFDSGAVKMNDLKFQSSAFSLTANGGLGLGLGRRDSLQFVLSVDSLSGLRQLFASTDTLPTLFAAVADSMKGVATVRGTLSGTLDSTDSIGLHVRALARANDLLVGGWQAARVNVSADIGDLLRHPFGTTSLTLDSARAAGLGITTASARATLRDGLAERFGLDLRTTADATMTVAGSVSRDAHYATLPESQKLTRVLVDTLSVRIDTSFAARSRGFSLAAPAHFVVGADGSGSLDSLVLAHTDTGSLSLRGALSASGAVTGAFKFDRMPLADIGMLLQTPQLQGGRLNADATIGGTREHPTAVASLSLRDAAVSRVRLALFDMQASYDSTMLSVNGTLWADGRKALLASASLPLDLALVAGRERKIDKPLVGRLQSDSVSLSNLRTLFPDVTEATGSLNTDIALTGTWARPSLRGLFKLDDGVLALSNLGVRFDKVHADLALKGDTLLVQQLGARSGLPGDTLSVVGRIVFSDPSAPSFDLRLTARNFLAIDKARSASLTISTTLPVSLSGSTNAALVRGGVRIDRGRVYVRELTQKRAIDLTDNFDVIDTNVIRMDALLPKPPTAIVEHLTLDNVLIEIGDDVWLRSPEANIKLGGALRVTRSAGRDGSVARLALADSLTVQRGTYQLNLGLARPSFEVERGVIRFFGDPDLEPQLDISALHVVREVRANSNRQDVRIRVNIGGTASSPSLALTSADNPPLPESDMLSYLVTGEPANLLLGTRAGEQGATLLLRWAGSYFSNKIAGGAFDLVQIEPTAIAPGEAATLQSGLGILAATRLALGLQVGNRTYLSLSTGFCGLNSQGNGNADALASFAQGLGIKAERRLDGGFSLALGIEPGSSAQTCGRLGLSRTFQQTPQQFGADLFKNWTW
jgi:translocation and assembly module TamB